MLRYTCAALETGTVSCVEVALAPQPIREDHVVTIEFDMPINDIRHRNSDDAAVVNQISRWNQHAIYEDGMIRRKPQIALRSPISESTSRNPGWIDAIDGCNAR